MYIVFEKDGFQYVADRDEIVKMQRIDAKEGENIIIDRVLLLKDGDNLEVGKPYIDGVKIEAEVIEHGHDPTIIVYKYKRRKNYRRKKGHRQLYTKVKIKNILREA